MSFLNPLFFIGSLALAVPVLIHLVRREKSEIIKFSSLMFLLRVPKKAIRQQIIKNLLLMALRLLILALLVGAFARPFMTQHAAQIGSSDQNRGIVMLLDNSYSMRYGSNFDRMKSEAIRRIDGMRSGDSMSLIAFNDSATMLRTPTSDKGELKAAVDALEPSFGGTRFYEAFAMADRAFSQFGTPQKQLIMISDFQKTGWNRSSRESVISNDVKTETVDLGVDNSTNVGIDSVLLDHTSFNRTYAGRVVTRVNNHRKDQAVTVPVSLSINDKGVEKKTVTVSASSTALVEFTGFDLPLGYSKGRVRIEAEDALPVDNEFLFALNRREKLKVLIIDSGNARQSLYLRQAFSSNADLPFDLKVAQAQGVTPEEIGSYDVVLINDVPRLSDRVRDRMDELRKTGQGQVVILGTNVDQGWWNSYAKFPVQASKKMFVEKERGKSSFSLTTYDRNHNIFTAFEKSTKLALSNAQFFALVQTQPKQGATVLAKFEDGSPAIIESPKEDRGMLVFASTVDNSWNDLPLRPSFLPLFHEMVRYVSRYSETRGWYALGEGVPVSGGIENAAAAVIDPKGGRLALGELTVGQQKFFTPELPGFYEIRVGRDSRIVAVNPPSSEGNLDRMSPEDLLASVQRTKGETQQASIFGDDDKEDYARRQNGWWYLLLFALLAGIAEIYLANKSYNKA
jgi:hypothetical protein